MNKRRATEVTQVMSNLPSGLTPSARPRLRRRLHRSLRDRHGGPRRNRARLAAVAGPPLDIEPGQYLLTANLVSEPAPTTVTRTITVTP